MCRGARERRWLVEIIGIGAGEVVGFEAINGVGLDDEDVFAGLEFAGDFQEIFLGDDEAEVFEELGLHDGIADAGFVFEADENEAFGGAGALTADDVAGDGDDLAFAAAREVDGAPDVWKLWAEERHGMRTGGEAHSFVIGAEPLGWVHGRER